MARSWPRTTSTWCCATSACPTEVVTRWPHKRGQNGRIKAVALTGFGTEQDVQRSKEAGFDFHLVKPINFQELQKILDQSGA